MNNNGTVKEGKNGMDSFRTSIKDFDSILSISPGTDLQTLSTQMISQPSIYARFTVVLEELKWEVANCKLDIKIMEAEIAKRIRALDPKASEARIERMLYEEPEYIELTQKHNKLKFKEGELNAVVRALEQRHSILLTLSSLAKQELRQL